MDRDRLSREAWLRTALTALGEDGVDALKVDRLARRLGVSRGSFYWHFADVRSFHDAIFDTWERVAIDEPLGRSVEVASSNEEGLNRLIALAFEAPTALERAIHQWAKTDKAAATRVSRVDSRRRESLEAMFRRAGLTQTAARARSRILYWAYMGRVLADAEPTDAATLAEISARLGL